MAILGIDEVGRGPWAGPLVVGAVILPDPAPDWVAELKDSKKLSPRKREDLSQLILSEAMTGLGWVAADELDKIGLSAALKLAARRAIKSMQGQNAKFSQIVIDGNLNLLTNTPFAHITSTLIKADDLIKEVSAASIIAKVARDRYMAQLASEYPAYGFERHKGYGTALHKSALTKFGPCPEHRLSFAPVCRVVNQFASSDPLPSTPESPACSNPAHPNSTTLGAQGETAVIASLEKRGHTIIARNFKTKLYEIDIISQLDDHLYFTEVKYRRDDSRGGGLAAITPAKKHQMEFAARLFLHQYPKYRSLQPLLAVADVAGSNFQVRDIVILTE